MTRNYNKLFPLLAAAFIVNILFTGYYIVSRHLRQPAATAGYSYNRDKIYKTFPVYPTSKVLLGDNQTRFFDLEELTEDTSIKNRGIMGDNTPGILHRLPDITKGKPASIFIQAGINDFWNNHISADSCLKNYRSIILHIRKDSPQTRIFVQSIFPSKEVSASTIVKFNNGLKAFVRQYDLVFIDLYPHFNRNGTLKPEYDSGDGYKTWKNILLPYLNE